VAGPVQQPPRRKESGGQVRMDNSCPNTSGWISCVVPGRRN
jgi:hypothetical protein